MILDSSCLYGSGTRLRLTIVSLSEGHDERMDYEGLDKNLILKLLLN